MAFIFKKFNFPVKSNFTGNFQDYSDALLNGFKNAFIEASANWSLESDIVTIGTNTDTQRGCRTLQLQNSVTGKHLRIWAFAGQTASCTISSFVTTDTASGTYDRLCMHVNNVFRYYTNKTLLGSGGYVYFGIANHTIDADFGYDLQLDVPIFTIASPGSSGNAPSISSSMRLSDYSTGSLNNDGATFGVITDGSMFGITKLYPNGTLSACFYADDMFVCANSGDLKKAGVICCTGGNFYLGQNSSNETEGNVNCVFADANGSFNYTGLSQHVLNNKKSLQSAWNSNKLVCGPLTVAMYNGTWNGSTYTGVTNGIGIKGWINSDYVRNTDCDALVYSNRGLKYANGRWLCVDAGTLICWDDSNESPFEAA